jgi:hypothetical protein
VKKATSDPRNLTGCEKMADNNNPLGNIFLELADIEQVSEDDYDRQR